MSQSGRRGRWRVHLAWAFALVLAVAATFWAARSVARPVADGEGAAAPIPSYVAGAGEVGETVSQQGRVAFGEGIGVFSGRSGVVTALSIDPDRPIQAGDVVATVDLSPVVVAPGAVPAFRDMAQGTRGPDVAQLRAFLGLPQDDRFDAATRRAVLAWKRSLGITDPSSTVALGELVFVPALPARAVPADGVVVGARIEAGEALLTTLKDRPVVSILLDSAPKATVGMPAVLQAGETTLEGVLGPITVGADGLRRYEVLGADGSGICDAACSAAFPAVGETPVTVTLEVSPVVAGIVVPSSAVGVQPDGSRAVRSLTGGLVPVEVLAESGGMCVVAGLDEGTEIALFEAPA